MENAMWETASMRRVRAVITGRVQGVSYRASAAHEAQRLGIKGWVRNLPDDSVELDAEGPGDAIGSFLQWCARGPHAARVDRVAVEELAPGSPHTGFEIRYR